MNPMSPSPASSSPLVVTPSMYESLRATRPWVIFLGVMSFIGAGFMVLGGLGMAAMGSRMSSGSGPALGLVYLVMSVFYIIGGVYLVRYGSAIGRLLNGGGTADMEAALAGQKSFWKYAGILTLVMIILSIVGVVIAIVVGAASMMR